MATRQFHANQPRGPFTKEAELNDKWRDDSSPIRPAYYAKYKIDPWTFCIENEVSLAVGSVIKYVMRFKDKNGLEDLQKAEKCIKMMIEHYYPESKKEEYNRACMEEK